MHCTHVWIENVNNQNECESQPSQSSKSDNANVVKLGWGFDIDWTHGNKTDILTHQLRTYPVAISPVGQVIPVCSRSVYIGCLPVVLFIPEVLYVLSTCRRCSLGKWKWLIDHIYHSIYLNCIIVNIQYPSNNCPADSVLPWWETYNQMSVI